MDVDVEVDMVWWLGGPEFEDVVMLATDLFVCWAMAVVAVTRFFQFFIKPGRPLLAGLK